MKLSSRLSGALVLLGAMFMFTGCQDTEPGKAGVIPPAWDEPGTPRIGGGNNRGNEFKVEDEKPTPWGQGSNDGSIDERTGVRRMEVAGFPKTLYFGYDTDRISSQDSLQTINEAIQYLNANPGMVLVIEGHCDERGTEEYNRALGERRAIAVESKLREANIDLARIRTVSYGEDKPAASGTGESIWSQNRRAVLWVGKLN